MGKPKLLQNVKFLQKCIIVSDDKKILILKRDPKDFRRPGCWDFPGGNYEQGESAEDCIKREVEEETSLVIDKIQPVHLASNFGESYQDINVIAVCHASHNWTGKINLSSEHIEYRWVTVNEFMILETGDDGGFLKTSLQKFQEIYG